MQPASREVRSDRDTETVLSPELTLSSMGCEKLGHLLESRTDGVTPESQ